MSEKFYSVMQLSSMLGIHPKTLQRYIREGKLRANKIGKSWRVSGHDLSVFTEQHPNLQASAAVDAPTHSKPTFEASAVVDIDCIDQEQATRITNMLGGALHSKPSELGQSSMHIQYIPQADKLRISLWGEMRFMETLFHSIAAIADDLVD